MKAPEKLEIEAGHAPALPATWFEAEAPVATLVAMAALGVPARFYGKLAEALRAASFNVLLLEQRGHGESPLRPSRKHDWGFREAVLHEIPRALREARERSGALPLYLFGHSLGGHYASMTVGLERDPVDGVILAACASPWLGGFTGKTRRDIKMLHVAIPTLTRLLGYFPGDRLGFGGREARGLMLDWLALSKTNRYAAKGIPADLDIDAGIARYQGPLLVLRFTQDPFAPEAGVSAVVQKYGSAAVTDELFDEAALGARPDHFQWAKTPGAVVRAVVAWHASVSASRVLA